MALVIRETKTPIADLFPEDTVFFDEIVDGVLLMLIESASDTRNDEGKRIQNRGHSRILTIGGTA